MGLHQTLKICHLASGDLWAGAEVQLFTLLKCLKDDAQIQVALVLLNDGLLAERCRALEVRVKIIDESKLSFFALRKELARYLSAEQFEILHSHRFKENILAGSGGNQRLVKHLVQTVHGWPFGFETNVSVKDRMTGAWNRQVSNRHFERVIAVSEELNRRLRDRIEPTKLITIHNAIDTDSIRPGPPTIDLREKFNLPREALLIGSAGRLVPIKRYDLFIESARLILKDCPEAVFLLAGEGPELSRLKSLVESAQLNDKFLFTGFLDDVIEFLRSLDLFVMSSDHEGIPMVLLEAMALARPVLATAVGGMTEVIEDKLSGRLVAPGSANSLAEACLECLTYQETRELYGQAARARIEEEFSASMLKERMTKLYQSLQEKR